LTDCQTQTNRISLKPFTPFNITQLISWFGDYVMREKRRLQRFSLRFPARVEVLDPTTGSGRQVLDLTTRDISSDGAFLNTDTPLPEGTKVKLELSFSIKKSKTFQHIKSLIKFTGLVARSETEGMAICFRRNYSVLRLTNT
jgi:hypothetical protein